MSISILTFIYSCPVFMCSIKEGSIELLEHNDGKWITKEELNTLNWLPADIDAVNYLKENM